MLSKRVSKHAAGVTLIELMIAIVILGILITMGLPSFSTWIQNARTRSETESLLRGLQLARQEAISHNANVQLVLNGRDWSVNCETVSATCPTGMHARTTSGTSPVTLTESTGAGVYRFGSDGRLTQPDPNAGASFTSIDVTSNTLTGSDARNLRVTITIGGAARVCDPAVTDAADLRVCP